MESSIPAQDGLLLWAETFGDRHDPAVLLIMGATAPGIVWPDELCRLLAAAGYYVVRYDHRDTGRSGKSADEYDLATLAADAAAVTTGLGVGPAHVVGQSAGGMVAQLLALTRPELVSSLVLLSTAANPNPDGPPPPPQPTPPPAPPEEPGIAAVAGWRTLVGPNAPFDQAYWGNLVERVAARGSAPDTSGRHLTAMARTPSLFGRITALRVPTLVVHGDRDPVFSLELGEALHRAIPRAQFRCIPGMGHIFPPQWSPLISRLITNHLRLAAPEHADPGQPVS